MEGKEYHLYLVNIMLYLHRYTHRVWLESVASIVLQQKYPVGDTTSLFTRYKLISPLSFLSV